MDHVAMKTEVDSGVKVQTNLSACLVHAMCESEGEAETHSSDYQNEGMMDANNVDYNCASVREIRPRKKKKVEGERKVYRQKFLETWKMLPGFEGWLEKSDRSTFGNDIAFCSVCNCDITCGKSEIKRHMLSKRHQKRAMGVKFQSLNSSMVSSTSTAVPFKINEVQCTLTTKQGCVEERKLELECLKLEKETEKLQSERIKFDKEKELADISIRIAALTEQKLKLEISKVQLEKEKLERENQQLCSYPIQFVTSQPAEALNQQ